MSVINGDLSAAKSVKESEWKWIIKKSSILSPELSEDPILKFDFKLEGKSWHLYLIPNSRDGFIELHLVRNLFGISGPPIEIEFSVSIKTTKGRKMFERRKWLFFSGSYSGYTIHKWIKRSELSMSSEFMSSKCVTILFTMKWEVSEKFESGIAAAACSCCKKIHCGDNISLPKKYLKKLVKCSECGKMLSLKNWFDHKCQMANIKGATSSGVSSLVCDHGKILQGLKQLLFSQAHSDVVLRVKGEEFRAHKAILAVRSPVFASTFRHEMKENETGIVDIEDCDPAVFPDFLRFLYSNDTDNLSGENVFGLFTIADKYDCQELRVKCVNFIKENLTVETFCKALALALLHNEAELLRVATDFFIKNANKILVTVDWQTFTVENPLVSNELFIKYVNSTMHSNT